MANEDWMAELDDDVQLSQVVMPGSHDACMYECRANSTESDFVIQSSVTQFLTIQQQLEAGTRFFDIRIYKDRNTGVLRPGHFPSKDSSTSGMGEYGPPFADICDQFDAFLTAHRGEAVMIKFSLSKNAKKNDAAINMIGSKLGKHLYSTNQPEVLAEQPIRRLRGKLIALFDKPEGTMPGQVKTFHQVSKKTPAASDRGTALAGCKRSIMWLNGDAPTSDKIATVMSKQNAKRIDPGSQGALAPHLEMFYLTITAGTGTAIKAGLDLLDLSGNRALMCVADNTAREIGLTGVPRTVANRLRSKYEAWAPGAGAAYRAFVDQVRGRRAPNIYMFDFMNEDTNTMVLRQNSSRW